MLRRWHVLLLIVITLAAFCVLAATKLRATPKYDRVQVGMRVDAVVEILNGWDHSYGEPASPVIWAVWKCDEGVVTVGFRHPDGPLGVAVEKQIERRGPLERLAWLAGWR